MFKNARKSAFLLKYLEIYQFFADAIFFAAFSMHKSFGFDHQNHHFEKFIFFKFFIKKIIYNVDKKFKFMK